MEFVKEDGYESDDSGLFVEFYTKAVVDPAASKEAGHEVCKDVDYIKMQIDAYSCYDQPVRDDEYYSDVMRFPRQWEAYKNKKTDASFGVPIEKLFPNEPSKAVNYRYRGIMTVEQLSATSDGNLMGMGMGSSADRKRATEFLDVAKEQFASEQYTKMQAANNALQEQIIQMKADMDKYLTEHAKAGLKRPRKAEPEADGLEDL